MIPSIRRWYHRWRELLKDGRFRTSFLAGWFSLAASFVITQWAAIYTHTVPVKAVGDLILDRIPIVDLGWMYSYGMFVMIAVTVVYTVFFKPEILPFSAKTIGAFFIIRACFISLTHLGAPENFLYLSQFDNPFFRVFFVNDLFFSGHVGFPFLAALLFWENKVMRGFFIFMSIAQAFTVLFMHVHYSIDVFSAYFITYTIYVLSDKIFNRLNQSFHKIVMRVEERLFPKQNLNSR